MKIQEVTGILREIQELDKSLTQFYTEIKFF